MTGPVDTVCPCGGAAYATCCGPLHSGARLPAPPQTPEALMRSRYSAFVRGDVGYLVRTWHPRTRPAELTLDPDVVWTGLVVHEAGEDWVEFSAHHRDGVLRERSRFAVRAGRWLYLDGTHPPS
ncbi:YchJ family protein [Nocardioides sp.]|uniref:YchJ family protein n=1 Tax=Nocardioides sp. TaxID=35761 RepID=UPI003511A704